MRNVSHKSCRENEITFYVQSLFSDQLAVYQITWKNMVQPHMTQQYNTAHALCIRDYYDYRHTVRIFNTDCFSTTTIVSRTCLIVALPLSFLEFDVRDPLSLQTNNLHIHRIYNKYRSSLPHVSAGHRHLQKTRPKTHLI